MNNGSWNRLIEEGRVDDAAFGRAYSRTSEAQRAALKEVIALHYRMIPPAVSLGDSLRRDWAGGFSGLTRAAPRRLGILALAPAVRSPSQLLAALMPMLTARVEKVAVIRAGAGPFPQAMLTALELAGQELVTAVPRKEMGALLDSLACLGPEAVVVSLGDAGADGPKGRLACYRLPAPPRIGLFFDGPGEVEEVDFDLLSWAQKGSVIEICGRPGRGISAYPMGPEDFDGFMARDFDGVIVPRRRLEQANKAFPLAVAHGREAFWAWPNLPGELFVSRGLALEERVTQEGERE